MTAKEMRGAWGKSRAHSKSHGHALANNERPGGYEQVGRRGLVRKSEI